MNKVRAINYSLDKSSTIRVFVGGTHNIIGTEITVSRIIALREGVKLSASVYVTSPSNEETLWKDVSSDNMVVEYELDFLAK